MSTPEGYKRSRERADAIRAQLQPLGPDERPLGLKLAFGLAVLIAVANLVGAVAGAGGASPVTGVGFAIVAAPFFTHSIIEQLAGDGIEAWVIGEVRPGQAGVEML